MHFKKFSGIFSILLFISGCATQGEFPNFFRDPANEEGVKDGDRTPPRQGPTQDLAVQLLRIDFGDGENNDGFFAISTSGATSIFESGTLTGGLNLGSAPDPDVKDETLEYKGYFRFQLKQDIPANSIFDLNTRLTLPGLEIGKNWGKDKEIDHKLFIQLEDSNNAREVSTSNPEDYPGGEDSQRSLIQVNSNEDSTELALTWETNNSTLDWSIDRMDPNKSPPLFRLLESLLKKTQGEGLKKGTFIQFWLTSNTNPERNKPEYVSVPDSDSAAGQASTTPIQLYLSYGTR